MTDKRKETPTETELYAETWNDKTRRWWQEQLPCVKIAIEEIEAYEGKKQDFIDIKGELEKRILKRIKKEIKSPIFIKSPRLSKSYHSYLKKSIYDFCKIKTKKPT